MRHRCKSSAERSWSRTWRAWNEPRALNRSVRVDTIVLAPANRVRTATHRCRLPAAARLRIRATLPPLPRHDRRHPENNARDPPPPDLFEGPPDLSGAVREDGPDGEADAGPQGGAGGVEGENRGAGHLHGPRHGGGDRRE